MIVQQTQNAFNDKLAQFMLIALGGAVAVSVESAAGIMISLPFVLFAPVAGWLSDRYSKRTVLLGSALLQSVALLWVYAAVLLRNLPLAMVGFFILAVQAAFFSPAKLGINKELVGSRHLGFATSIQQMLAMLAMLAGQIVAGHWFDVRFHELGGAPSAAWPAAAGPLLVLTLTSLPALVLAWIVPRVPAQGGGPFRLRVCVSHFGALADLWRDRSMRRASFGVAFFWGFAAYLNLWTVKLAKVLTHGNEGFGSIMSLFMAAASLGMAAGFGFSSWILRKRIHLGLVVPAALLMALLSFVLARVPVASAAGFLRFVDWRPEVWLEAAREVPDAAVFLMVLGLLAFVSAVFLAPLAAWMQDRYPAEKRGELQSAANLQDCLAGIVAVCIIAGIETVAELSGVAPLDALRPQMLLVGACCLLAAVLIVRMMPAELLRWAGVGLVRLFHRVRVVGADRVAEQGGMMLLANHVTFADAFFIAAANRRPVRFVMDGAFAQNRAIGWFTAVFQTVNIRREQPLEAIRTVIGALKQGDLVCFFPEGQLSRTGAMSRLQRGFELIARKSGHPLVPLWCDGSWGSVASFERGCYFRKWPRRESRRLVFAFGEALNPAQATIEVVRDSLLRASAEAVAARFADECWRVRLPRRGGSAAVAGFVALGAEARVRMWANGHQVGMLDALPWRGVIHVLDDDPCPASLPGLFAAFPTLFGVRVIGHRSFDGGVRGIWVGGSVLRDAVEGCANLVGIDFHDFSPRAMQPLELTGLRHFPALAVDGVVVAMSLVDPPPAEGSFEVQLGRRPGALGRLLPGWFVERGADGTWMVRGPAAPACGLPLPQGWHLDDEGFIGRGGDGDDPEAAGT
jgi:acyl-[acyl-carrier-protein]-phospholipid O-acyltransferase / long-chain-fatty-acid--[acyl-carrier-protein] ligase